MKSRLIGKTGCTLLLLGLWAGGTGAGLAAENQNRLWMSGLTPELSAVEYEVLLHAENDDLAGQRTRTRAGLLHVPEPDGSSTQSLWLDDSKLVEAKRIRILKVSAEQYLPPSVVLVGIVKDGDADAADLPHIVDVGISPPFISPSPLPVLVETARFSSEQDARAPSVWMPHMDTLGKDAYLFSGPTAQEDRYVTILYDRKTGAITQEQQDSCAKDKRVVAACYDTRGVLSFHRNHRPYIRTEDALLEIAVRSEPYAFYHLPAQHLGLASPKISVLADFRVCPFAAQTAGAIGSVCIEKIKPDAFIPFPAEWEAGETPETAAVERLKQPARLLTRAEEIYYPAMRVRTAGGLLESYGGNYIATRFFLNGKKLMEDMYAEIVAAFLEEGTATLVLLENGEEEENHVILLDFGLSPPRILRQPLPENTRTIRRESEGVYTLSSGGNEHRRYDRLSGKITSIKND